MGTLEQKIKAFVKDQGVEVVGVAGPDRLDGPPSLDPTYTMRGARSIVTMALPMNVDAIYDFLGKKSPAPHNVDQYKLNQKLNWITTSVANYISSLGYRAKAVAANGNYRRSLNTFAVYPSFSHRCGAIVSGIAAQGWSGNVMSKEYGASMYLGTIVTDARLESDEPMHPRFFIDNYCKNCKLCERTCVAGMFEPEREEYLLINKELHPRGRRVNLDICSTSCFGLHALSRDKKWTTWGDRWIKEWVDHSPGASDSKLKNRYIMMREVLSGGDTATRYDFIRNVGHNLLPKKVIEDYANKHPENKREIERTKMLFDFAGQIGISGLRNERILTCGQCSLVCGPTLEETAKRYKTLIESGLVVPGPEGEMVNVTTYEEAVEKRKKYLPEFSGVEKLKNAVAFGIYWTKHYTGIEPKSIIKGMIYKRRLKKAIQDRVRGPADSVEEAAKKRTIP